mgnify:FL=1
MLKKIIYSLLVTGISFSNLSAQVTMEKCGWYEAKESLINGDEELRKEIDLLGEQFNSEVDNFNFATKMTPDTIIIPIVFHVIHNNGSENVSNEVIFPAFER